MTVHLKIWRWP